MSSVVLPTEVVTKLKLYRRRFSEDAMRELEQGRDDVLGKYGPRFKLTNIENLAAADITEFLQFRNNQHWKSLERLGPRMTEDMDSLHAALKLLADDTKPIENRFSDALKMAHGLGHGVASALLLIMFPQKYGVWNSVTQEAMINLGIFPEPVRGETEEQFYARINEVILAAAQASETDLWILDWIWWEFMKAEVWSKGEDPKDPPDPTAEDVDTEQAFHLEKYLHEFMVDNWQLLGLNSEWELYGKDGDKRPGYKYWCGAGIGQIDLLARHKTEPRWLMIELKRSHSDDQAVGQVLRYMGWVMENLAEKGQTVEGLIVAQEQSKGLECALKAAPAVEFLKYSVNFSLDKPNAD